MRYSKLNSRQIRTGAIGIEVCFEGHQHEFTLPEWGGNAIKVGSNAAADVRILKPEIAPAHFHIERDGLRVWIVPTFGLDTRVNGALLIVPRVIVDQAVVEISGVRLYIRVFRDEHAGHEGLSWDSDTLGWGSASAGELSIPRGTSKASTREALCSGPSHLASASSSDEITLFDPIVSAAKNKPAAPISLDQNTERGTITLCQRCLKAVGALGALGVRQPRVIWLGGSLAVFSVSALLSWTLRPDHGTRVDTERTSVASHKTIAGMSGTPAPSTASTVNQSPGALTPLKAPAVEDKAANSAHLRVATGHLIAGRYSDAQRAYLNLATEVPTDPALVAVSRLLSLRVGKRCMNPQTSRSSCPEIKQ